MPLLLLLLAPTLLPFILLLVALQQPVPFPQQQLPVLPSLYESGDFDFYEIGESALEATLIGPLDVSIGLLCIPQHPVNNHK
jgi:hypothetical protein